MPTRYDEDDHVADASAREERETDEHDESGMAFFARDGGQFGSYPLYESMDDESDPDTGVYNRFDD